MTEELPCSSLTLNEDEDDGGSEDDDHGHDHELVANLATR